MSTENGLATASNTTVMDATDFALGQVLRVRLDRIRPFPGQPRSHFEQPALENLARSLKIEQKLPLTVRVVTDDPNCDYEIVDGERRFRAAKIAGLKHIMVWVKKVQNENTQYVDSVISNFGREDHTPLEKANALFRLYEMGMTQVEIADQCGYTQGWVNQHLSLLRLQPEVRALMDPSRPKEKQLPFSLALRLVNVPAGIQQEIANEIVDKNVPAGEARFFIQSKVHEAGANIERTGRTGRHPYKDHKIVSGFTLRLERQTELTADIPADSFKEMFGSRSEAEVSETVRQIESAIANLQRLITKIRTAKPESAPD